MPSLKVGMCLANSGMAAGKRAIDELASMSEKYEFNSVWTNDHLLVPKEYAASYGRILESLATLSYVAGRTERILLGTSVLVLPMREVILLAKQSATLQILSRGRLVLGLGAGWLGGEFENVRLDFSQRGQYYDEGLQLFRWFMKGNANFAGEFYTIRDGVFDPTPDKPIPLLIGGNSGQSIRRAAKLGDGWFPIAIPPSELRAGRQKLSKLTSRRMEIALRISVVFSERARAMKPETATDSEGAINARLAGTREEILEQIRSYRKAGLDHLVCYFGDREANILKVKARKFAKEIVPSL